MTKPEIGYKLVNQIGEELLSAITSQTLRVSNPFVLRYAQDLDTVPAIGYSMVFASERSARNFGRSLLEKGSHQLWRCEYDPAPLKRPAFLTDWDDPNLMQRFWEHALHGAPDVMYHNVSPNGTRCATRVRLLERLA